MKKFYAMAVALLATFSASAGNIDFKVDGKSVNSGDRIDITSYYENDFALGDIFKMPLVFTPNATGKLSVTCDLAKASVLPEGDATVSICGVTGKCVLTYPGKPNVMEAAVSSGKAIDAEAEVTVNLYGQNIDDMTINCEVILTFSLGGEESQLTFFIDKTAGVEGVTIDEAAPATYYDLQGRRVAEPQNGIYVMRQGGKTLKVLK